LTESLYSTKQNLIQHCLALNSIKVEGISTAIDSLKEGQQNETKSSAGDKFETSREMMQAEIDKLQSQLGQLLTDQRLLKLHSKLKEQEFCVDGSLVKTDRGTFLISVGLGRIKMDTETFFVISQNAPIAKPLLHLKTGDSFTFNNVNYEITGTA